MQIEPFHKRAALFFYIKYPLHISCWKQPIPSIFFSFFYLIYFFFIQGIDKATLFRNLLFRQGRKEEISKNRLRLGVSVLLPVCIFVFQMNKGLPPKPSFRLLLYFFLHWNLFVLCISNIRSKQA